MINQRLPRGLDALVRVRIPAPSWFTFRRAVGLACLSALLIFVGGGFVLTCGWPMVLSFCLLAVGSVVVSTLLIYLLDKRNPRPAAHLPSSALQGVPVKGRRFAGPWDVLTLDRGTRSADAAGGTVDE